MIRHCDFSRFLPRQLRKRAAGRRRDEQQRQNHTQYAGALLFRQEQNPLLHRGTRQTQSGFFPWSLRKYHPRVGNALLGL